MFLTGHIFVSVFRLNSLLRCRIQRAYFQGDIQRINHIIKLNQVD